MELKYNSETKIVSTKSKQGYLVNITLAEDASNCKLSYIHRAGCLSNLTGEERKEYLNFALSKLKGCIIINTTNEEIALWIKETYPTYYYHNVPIGYYNGFQYHLCIKNTISPNYNCKDPLPEVVAKPVVAEAKPLKTRVGYTRTKVATSLKEYLNERGMSTKFVSGFIKHLIKK